MGATGPGIPRALVATSRPGPRPVRAHAAGWAPKPPHCSVASSGPFDYDRDGGCQRLFANAREWWLEREGREETSREKWRLRVRRSAIATRRSRREALLTHQAGHTLARDPIVERPKVAKDPWTAGTISSSRLGPLAQLGERLVRNQEVAGSIPARSTKQANRLRGVGSGEESRSVRFRSGLFPRLAHALGALCADGRAAVGASVEKRHSTTPRGRALA
jgi:hypothetical protein